MKWITHQTGAVLAASALGLPLPAIAAALCGAVWPDMVDQHLSKMAGNSRKSRQKAFNRLHRGASHWFGWYAALLVAICAYSLPVLARELALGFALGALSHVILDMLTPQGIPLLPFSRKGKLAAPLCVTGHWSEFFFLTIMTAGGVWYLISHGTLARIFN